MPTVAHALDVLAYLAAADVAAFLAEHGLEILFGAVASATSAAAVYYARRADVLHRRQILPGGGRSVTVFLTREAMIDTLITMYSRAQSGDDLWAQGVGLSNYPGDVSEAILNAAQRGVRMRYIANAGSPALSEFESLFAPIRTATVIRARDNDLRVQGLGQREVVIAFPTMRSYTAIRVTDQAFVRLMRDWFDRRFELLQGAEEGTS